MIKFEKGKRVYYVPTLTDKPVLGTVIDIICHGLTPRALTIRTRDGETITDTMNHFSRSYPTICKFWT